jgi:hypothetical protein
VSKRFGLDEIVMDAVLCLKMSEFYSARESDDSYPVVSLKNPATDLNFRIS